ncbi:transcriptional regulator, LacI family [Bryocella elongata]|uniref:Transcriptional regulator, LacI family n=1 Tax=Bryocella elongata TaxID=863522 RepID=A0A1H6C8Q3_9BACT|nr:LacI family DNA-binding transcriptional regulator [Bryocella elongata]SEG69015.1 transcriptional regulator, LacI family [Bryocella elongata]
MNMRDIAKLAGVSSATVSNVINGSKVVRPVTAARVRKVIEEMRFVPNGSATTLKYGRSSTYGLIIPDITNPFFPEFIRSFEGILVERNQDMLMATTDFHYSQMQQTIRRMLIRQVDGVALLAAEIETEPIEALIHHRVPLVTMDRRVTGRGLSDVSIDYASGMRAAIQHLKKLRHRKVAYIGGSSGPTISDHRVEAFKMAVAEGGLKVRPELIRVGNYRISGGEAGMEEILQLKDQPTAILCANDLTAIGALRVIRRHGLSAPEDFSVIGFDDIDLADIIFPPLTTIRLARPELAAMFYEALTSFGTDPHKVGKQYTVGTSLVLRSSTGAPRALK